MTAMQEKDLDVQRLMKGVFKDDWMVKTGIGGVLGAAGLVSILYSFMCLPILAAFWALTIGYCLRCMRLKAADPEAPLPPWNDWGDLFMSGMTWIALQSGIWITCLALQAIILKVCLDFAYLAKSQPICLIWCATGCTLVVLALSLLALLSSYVMVNFAIEENARAGYAFVKVARSLIKSPLRLTSGFLLATGVQYMSVLLPSLTLVGIFLVPSTSFVGNLVASILLAKHWCSCNEVTFAASE
jgi:hypothetical protein